MSMERWEPWRDMMSLRDAMERLIQDSVVRPAGAILPGGRMGMPLDIAERDDHFEVRASLPGYKPDEVHVMVQGDTLTIRARRNEDEEQKNENWIVRERRTGSLTRSITLPVAVDADKATARFEDGVLTLELPKAETSKPKQIPLSQSQRQAGAQSSQSSSQGKATQVPVAAESATSGTSGTSATSGGQGNGQSQSAAQASAPTEHGETGPSPRAANAGSSSAGEPEGAQPHAKDQVTEASMESFPASDAPSWTSERT